MNKNQFKGQFIGCKGINTTDNDPNQELRYISEELIPIVGH